MGLVRPSNTPAEPARAPERSLVTDRNLPWSMNHSCHFHKRSTEQPEQEQRVPAVSKAMSLELNSYPTWNTETRAQTKGMIQSSQW